VVSGFFDLFSTKDKKKESYTFFDEITDGQIYAFNKLQEGTIKNFQGRVISSIDKKTGIITISVKMPDPKIAGFVANQSLEYLKKYVVDYRLEKLKTYEKFLNTI
jgi:hypothetical protein